MYDCYFTFRSITGAQRAEQALYDAGLRGRLLRAPKYLSSNGCGYAMKVRGRDAMEAAAAFSAQGVVYVKIFRVYPSGDVEETFL